MALFRTLPTPTNDLLPRLMVEVCLVLDVNFFLNSRKQGLPCWRIRRNYAVFLSLSMDSGHSSRRRGTCAGKSTVHPRNLWVRGSNLTGGSQTTKLPSFGGYSLETLTFLDEPWLSSGIVNAYKG